MTIRNFLPSDRAEYIAMATDFYSGDGALHPIGRDHFESTFDHILTGTDDSARGVILEQNGKTAGYALLIRYWSCEAGGETVLLDEVYIKSEFRGEGLGSTFMEWLAAEYPAAKRFRLEVCPQNRRVMGLYERFGYEVLDYIQMIRE